MRTIRGLQITSIVVLSPVLLCMVSLISILFSSIIGWIFPTIQQQPFPAKSAPYQRNSSINHVFKKLQFVFRLRQSSVTLVILFLYLFYILFKKKRNKNQIVANQDILLEENITSTKKRKNSKRRKYKKTSKPNAAENHHHHHHHVHSKPITTTTILHNKPQHNEQPNDDTSQDNWIHVKHHKEHVDNELNDDWNHQEQYRDTCNEQPQKYQDTCEQEQQQTEYYNDTDYDEIWNINQINMEDDDWYDERQMHVDTNDKQKSEEHTPELTPIESEDEDHKQFKNWYSPFSTGLDLDILPKHISPQLDPLTLKYDTALPIISNFYTPKRPPSIEILENYPYIPSTSHHNTSFTHSFGPIGDKKK